MSVLHRLSHVLGMNTGWASVVTDRSGVNWVAFVCARCGRVSSKSPTRRLVCRTFDEPPDHAFRHALRPLDPPNPDPDG